MRTRVSGSAKELHRNKANCPTPIVVLIHVIAFFALVWMITAAARTAKPAAALVRTSGEEQQ